MDREQLIRESRASTLATAVQKTVTPLLSLAVTILLARELGSESYGAYGLMQGILALVAVVGGLGLPFVFIRFIPEYRVRGRIPAIHMMVRKGLIVRAVASAAVLLVILAGWDWLGPAFGVEAYKDAYVVFCLAAVATVEVALLMQAMNALFLHAYVVAGQIGFVVLKLAALLALLAAGFSLVAVMAVEVLSACVLLAFLWLAYVRHMTRMRGQASKEGSPSDVVRDRPWRVRRYALFSTLNELGSMLFDHYADLFVIGHFLGAASMGVYYLASQVSRYVAKLDLAVQFQSVATPAYFSAYEVDQEHMNQAFAFLVKLGLLFTLPALFGFLILGRSLLDLLFGASYGASFSAACVLVSAVPLNALNYPSGLVLQAKEKVNLILYGKFFSLYNLALSVVLIKPYGLMGVAFSTASAVALRSSYSYLLARHESGARLPWRSVLSIVVCCLPMIGVLMVYWLAPIGWLPLVSIALAGAVVYVVAVWLAWPFTGSESKVFARFAGQRVGVVARALEKQVCRRAGVEVSHTPPVA